MALDEIPNERLRPEDVPAPDAEWDTIDAFGLTFNGYKACGSFEKCAAIANQQLDSTLTELRICLFFEGRRWHHYGDEPEEEATACIRGIVEKIRTKVLAGELE